MKPGFKQTEVGMIPEQWDVSELGEVISSMQLGGNYKNSKRETSWPLIKMGNLGRGNISLDKLEYVDSAQAPACRDRLETDDLLFNTRNTLDLVGKVAIWQGELPEAYYNSNIARLKFKADRVSSYKFMNYIMNTPRTLQSLRNIATGTTSVAAIYDRDLVKVEVPLPSLAEQEAIAEALGDADALIERLERLINKKRDVKHGAMQELLTGKRRLPGFTGKWEETTLGKIGVCVIGLTYKPENVVEHGLLVLRSSNIQNGRLVYEDNVHVNIGVADHLYTQLGDVLICVRNGSRSLIGKCALINGDAVDLTFGAFMSVYRTGYWPFIIHAFQSDDIQRQIRDNIGATINQITNKDMKAFRVKLPSVPEQDAIAAVLSDMDAELAALEAKLSKARAIKQGMMQELLTGRIRLK